VASVQQALIVRADPQRRLFGGVQCLARHTSAHLENRAPDMRDVRERADGVTTARRFRASQVTEDQRCDVAHRVLTP
jgi:hypothetical protein